MSNSSTEELRDQARQLLGKLREERDELKLQLHLATAEVRDEWEQLEPRFEELQAKARALTESVGATVEDLGAALSILGGELRHGYERIRKAMHD